MNNAKSKKLIGVCGCLTYLPDLFPIDFSENSGNMVHANAPLQIFENTVHIKDLSYINFGYENFVSFVNQKCSHVVITLANTLGIDNPDGSKYLKTIDFLNKIEKPLVVFGLGIQAKGLDFDSATLPSEAIESVRLLSKKSKLLGVRGRSTKAVLERICGVSNVFVTGCPSVFSDIKQTYEIPNNIKNPIGVPAFSGTRYFENEENLLLKQSVQSGHWLVETVNKFNHEFWIKVMQGSVSISDAPYFMKRFLTTNSIKEFEKLQRHFEVRYRLFRTTRDWYRFNKDFVSFSYGTRFHANMAALICGKPAVWLTHDERTRELTEFMHLPSVDIKDAQELDFCAPPKKDLYDDFFDHYPKLIDNFNEYLGTNDLPLLKINNQ